ncbi:bifunctional 2',3'-cyclic-nucleotide 2'-phosphodiesterase/3'-nucleotidase [Gemmobacter lutimaris]|uniref:Bifunctional 2',3'-cyclic-nucleotide 2'-phosphodiesterase/3'-nucleotidase n=1 Tax=Gemmobacter lutimaris TaxID=2306023 RepID=A0A398BY28_9RHOB|nr:bifunctional 2',3'-cyclic-nucleotide 2'-phosphodiesterase/3'-nucleotidase [Gemmobacter lutimaris]RID92830.1 bifunctional 2',3'-cyclic-nucleotide 2'-phosphodiesterase/3'-nucleotidase [Gemmobacter lutimaris]
MPWRPSEEHIPRASIVRRRQEKHARTPPGACKHLPFRPCYRPPAHSGHDRCAFAPSGYDYHTDRAAPGAGLDHVAALIAEARAEVPEALLFDNGDFLQGNPLGDFAMKDTTRPHPAITAMNCLGYDAATLGNHEFNFGLDRLESVIEAARFPVVTANVTRTSGARLLPPFCLLERALTGSDGRRHPVRIGVIGFVPPQIVQWDRGFLEGVVTAQDILECAAVAVPVLRSAGAEIIVALSHSGLGPAEAGANAEHATTALARIPGIDAIVAGHSHLPFPGPGYAGRPEVDLDRGQVFGTPVVLPGFNGSHLGLIDLDLAQDARQRWHVVTGHARLRHTVGVAPDPAIATAIAQDHAATLAQIRRPAGQTRTPLHSYFATILPSAALAVVAEAQADHVRQQLRGRPEADLPVLAAVSPFKAGGRGGPGHYTDIPAGPLLLRNIADLYVFPNTIAALRLTGAELADWLENSVGIYRQITPGDRDTPLIDADFPSYNHDQIPGLSYRIDLSQPARHDRDGTVVNPGARRIRDLCHHGRPLHPDQAFILATNNYRAAGCGGYTCARPERMVDVGHAALRDIVLRHLADNPRVPASLPAFSFLPMPDTSVTYDTAPSATAYLAELAHLRPEALGLTPEGFARFRLHL